MSCRKWEFRVKPDNPLFFCFRAYEKAQITFSIKIKFGGKEDIIVWVAPLFNPTGEKCIPQEILEGKRPYEHSRATNVDGKTSQIALNCYNKVKLIKRYGTFKKMVLPGDTFCIILDNTFSIWTDKDGLLEVCVPEDMGFDDVLEQLYL